MAERTRREMDAIEISEFLHSQHTGVLSLADGDDAYSIPVSFDYDEDEAAVYFRFGYGPDSQKRRYLDAVDTASFVVYDQTEGGWKSVVMEGGIERVSESSLDSSIREAVDELDIPYFQVHHRPAGDMDFNIVRLDATKLTGIVEGV
jgi:nitroimidazol reductase NimA-like FMN-containing flavoprotein (pyridoxamine 5'-phosphate oxidase superfamily)